MVRSLKFTLIVFRRVLQRIYQGFHLMLVSKKGTILVLMQKLIGRLFFIPLSTLKNLHN